jgi:hypothetical protein
VIEVDDTVGSAKKSDGGTNLNAGSVVAVVAAEHREVPPRIRVAALFNILHPCAVYSHRDVVLFLAGHRAGVTADATVLIDNKSVAHYKAFLPMPGLKPITSSFDSKRRRETLTDAASLHGYVLLLLAASDG